MQFLLNEDEFRALKAARDAEEERAKVIAQDYRRRLGEAIVKQVQPFFQPHDDREVARFLSGLRDAIHAVPVILENKPLEWVGMDSDGA